MYIISFSTKIILIGVLVIDGRTTVAMEPLNLQTDIYYK